MPPRRLFQTSEQSVIQPLERVDPVTNIQPSTDDRAALDVSMGESLPTNEMDDQTSQPQVSSTGK